MSAGEYTMCRTLTSEDIHLLSRFSTSSSFHGRCQPRRFYSSWGYDVSTVHDPFNNTFTKLRDTKTIATEKREEIIAAIQKLNTDTKPTVVSSEDVKALREACHQIRLHEEKVARLNMYLECFNVQLVFAEEH